MRGCGAAQGAGRGRAGQSGRRCMRPRVQERRGEGAHHKNCVRIASGHARRLLVPPLLRVSASRHIMRRGDLVSAISCLYQTCTYLRKELIHHLLLLAQMLTCVVGP